MQSSMNKKLLEYEYSETDHFKNSIIYSKMLENVKRNINIEDKMSINKYYFNLKMLYYLLEKYIETGNIDVAITIRKIIFISYKILVNYFNKKFENVLNELFEIYYTKNWDYGNAAEFQLMHSGIYSFKTTIEHKIMRIKSFYNGVNFQVNDEKVWDTIGDLINYCYIYLIWASKNFPMTRNIAITVE